MGEQRFLGDLLVKRGVVAPDRMEAFYAVQREKGADLTDLVVGAQICDDVVIARVLAEEAQLPVVETIDPERIPTALATRLRQPDRMIDFAVMTLTATVASPIAWEHHYGVTLPLFAVLAPMVVRPRHPRVRPSSMRASRAARPGCAS